MKRYTQAEYDAIKRGEDGYLRLPTGIYCDVDFGGASKIIIGAGSELGDDCTLGNWCELGNWCKLGNGCTLGSNCALGNWCTLGDGCELGNWCTLGSNCALGNWCTLGDGCSLEGDRVHNATYFKVSNIGSRNDSAYCYCDMHTGEIYVRTGCWFSGIHEFIARVHEVHAGTQHETDYLAFAEFARARFKRYMRHA